MTPDRQEIRDKIKDKKITDYFMFKEAILVFFEKYKDEYVGSHYEDMSDDLEDIYEAFDLEAMLNLKTDTNSNKNIVSKFYTMEDCKI